MAEIDTNLNPFILGTPNAQYQARIDNALAPRLNNSVGIVGIQLMELRDIADDMARDGLESDAAALLEYGKSSFNLYLLNDSLRDGVPVSELFSTIEDIRPEMTFHEIGEDGQLVLSDNYETTLTGAALESAIQNEAMIVAQINAITAEGSYEANLNAGRVRLADTFDEDAYVSQGPVVQALDSFSFLLEDPTSNADFMAFSRAQYDVPERALDAYAFLLEDAPTANEDFLTLAEASYNAANGENAWAAHVQDTRDALESRAGMGGHQGRNARIALNNLNPAEMLAEYAMENNVIANDPAFLAAAEADYNALNAPETWAQHVEARREELRIASEERGFFDFGVDNDLEAYENFDPQAELTAWAMDDHIRAPSEIAQTGIDNLYKNPEFLAAAEENYNAIHGEGAWDLHVEAERAAHDEIVAANAALVGPSAEISRRSVGEFNPDKLLADWATEHTAHIASTLDFTGTESLGLDPSVFRNLDAQSKVPDDTIEDRNTPIGASYLNAAEILYNERNGEGAWAIYADSQGWDQETADRELAATGESLVGWMLEDNLSTALWNYGMASDEAKIAVLYLQQLNAYKESSWGDLGNSILRGSVDPSMIVAMASGGTALGARISAQIAIRTAGKELLSATLRNRLISTVTGAAIGGAIEGAITEGALVYTQQQTGIDVGVRENYDPRAILTSAAFGGVFGAGLGGALGGVGHAISRRIDFGAMGRALKSADGGNATPAYRQFMDAVERAEAASAAVRDAGDTPSQAQLDALRDATIDLFDVDTADLSTNELAHMRAAHDNVLLHFEEIARDLDLDLTPAPASVAPDVDAAAPALGQSDLNATTSPAAITAGLGEVPPARFDLPPSLRTPDADTAPDILPAQADAPAIDVTTPELGEAPIAPDVPNALDTVLTTDLPVDAANVPSAPVAPSVDVAPTLPRTPTPIGAGYGPMTFRTTPGPLGIRDIAAAPPDAPRGTGGTSPVTPSAETKPTMPSTPQSLLTPEQAAQMRAFADELSAPITTPEPLDLSGITLPEFSAFGATSPIGGPDAPNIASRNNTAPAAPDNTGAASQPPTPEAGATTGPTSPIDGGSSSSYTARITGAFDWAGQRLKNMRGLFGARPAAEARSVKDFHDNIRDSVKRYTDALRSGTDFDTAHDTFKNEIETLRTSLERMGSKGFELSADGSTYSYGTYERGINITSLQRDGLLTTLDKALDMGVEIHALGSRDNLNTYLQGVATRAQNIAQTAPNQTVLNPHDAFILAGWKHGSNTGEGGTYTIGTTNVSQIRLLRYIIEEAADLHGRHSGPTPFLIQNAENVGGRLRALLKPIKENPSAEELRDTVFINSTPNPFNGIATKIYNGILAGLTTSDLISELNIVVARSKVANPFDNFTEIMQNLENKLAGTYKADGTLVASTTHPDGRIEITDPDVKPMLDRLRTQQERFWNLNNQGITYSSTLLGTSPDGSTEVDARMLRDGAVHSLMVTNSPLRYSVRPDGEASAAGIGLRSARTRRGLNVATHLLIGDTLDLKDTKKNIATTGSSFSYGWRGLFGENKPQGIKGWSKELFIKQPLRMGWRFMGGDVVPNAIKFMPDHWAGGRMQLWKHSNSMKAAYVLGAPIGIALNPVTWALGINPTPLVANGVWWLTHDNSEPTELDNAITALEADGAVETALAAVPFELDADAGNWLTGYTNADLVSDIRERAAVHVVAGQSHADASKLAAYEVTLMRAMELESVPTNNPEYTELLALAQSEPINPLADGALVNLRGIASDKTERFTSIRDALGQDIAALRGNLLPTTGGPTDAQLNAALDEIATSLASARENGAFVFDASNADARRAALNTGLLSAFDRNNNGQIDAIDMMAVGQGQITPPAGGGTTPTPSPSNGDGGIADTLRQTFNGIAPDGRINWGQTGDAVWSAVNTLTDHDSDGYSVFIDTAVGRSVSGFAQNVGGAIVGAHNNLGQTRQGQQTLNGMYAFGAALFAPWALSKLPGFGWLNSGGIRTLVIFASFFLGWKALNGGLMDNVMGGGSATDGDGTAGGEAQGSGDFVARAEASGARIIPHDNGIPREIIFEVDFDQDDQMDQLVLTDENKDGYFAAHVAIAGNSFVADKLINGNAFTSSTQFTPNGNSFNITDSASGQNITIDYTDGDGNEQTRTMRMDGNAMVSIPSASLAESLRTVEANVPRNQ